MNEIRPTDVSLLLEGGTFRTIYTGGILDYLIDQNIHIPYILGISAGAINAASYVSKQKERTLRIFTNYRHDKRYMGVRNFFKEKSLFGLDFAYNILPNQLDLFDWDTFYDFNGIVKFGVTNAYTGEVEYMNALEMDRECTMLRATCAIPFIFPEIKINDVPYFDGGLSEPIPIHQAIADGYERHVIILTRPKGYRKTLDRKTKWAMQFLRKKYPKLVDAMEQRVNHYNADLELCEQLEEEGKAFIFRPPYPLNSFEKNISTIKDSYQMGYELAAQRAIALEHFLTQKGTPFE